MEMAIDERRRDEVAAGVDDKTRLGLDARTDRGDLPACDGDVLAGASSGKVALRTRRSKDMGAPDAGVTDRPSEQAALWSASGKAGSPG